MFNVQKKCLFIHTFKSWSIRSVFCVEFTQSIWSFILDQLPWKQEPEQGDFTCPGLKPTCPRIFQAWSPSAPIVGAVLHVAMPQYPQSMTGYIRQTRPIFYQCEDHIFPFYRRFPLDALLPGCAKAGWVILLFCFHSTAGAAIVWSQSCREDMWKRSDAETFKAASQNWPQNFLSVVEEHF